MKFISIKEKQDKAYEALKADFGYKNRMQSPKLVKVVLNAGTGSIKDKNKRTLVGDRMTKIGGQKGSVKGAKKSIATFKVRTGDPVGYQITLRGQRMYDFLDRLINIALPRTRDFRGIKAAGIDAMGNYTLGIKEHIIFPETSDEELKDVFGFGVVVVTSSKDKKQSKAFLSHLGFPFKKNEEVSKK